MGTPKPLPPRLQAWADARRRHRLSHAHAQMARELGLNPTKLGTTLLTIAIALATTALERVLDRRGQRRALQGAVRRWPPERLAAADPGALGVFPQPGGADDAYRARPRDEDRALAQALDGARILVVHGPAREGKSRAAAKAAAEMLGEVPAIVPLNVDALCSLIDGSLRLELREQRICIWLDGLERFIDALDARALESLERLAPEVAVVATVRSTDWTELLEGSDQRSEAARALAGRAQVVELGQLDSGGEPSGRAAAASPAAGEPVHALPPLPLGIGLAGVLLAMVLVGAADRLFEPKPIEDQMASVREKALDDDQGRGRHIVVDSRVRFHGGEEDSWVLVLEDRRNHDDFYALAAGNRHGPPPRSDELRIYDVNGGRLKLKLRFRPTGVGTDAADWRKLEQGTPTASDVDDDNANEVI